MPYREQIENFNQIKRDCFTDSQMFWSHELFNDFAWFTNIEIPSRLKYQVDNKSVDGIEIGELGFTVFNEEECGMNTPYETSTDSCTLETTYLAKC